MAIVIKQKKLIFLNRMVTEVTKGIKVTVETEYQPSYSSPSQYHYVFTYRITIENGGDFTIQLMRRRWHIYDAGFTSREVEGEGVVGQQPVLEPGQTHTRYRRGAGWLIVGIGRCATRWPVPAHAEVVPLGAADDGSTQAPTRVWSTPG